MSLYRRVYAEVYGEIPESFHIHHLCGNNMCLNPEHLVAVSKEDHHKIHRRESFCAMTTPAKLERAERDRVSKETLHQELSKTFEKMIDPFELPNLSETLNG